MTSLSKIVTSLYGKLAMAIVLLFTAYTITSHRDKPAKALSPTPSLRTMLGQMFMIGFDGTSEKDPSVKAAYALLRDGKIGGVIVMGRNIQSPSQIKQLTTYYRSLKSQLPFIAIDQEGGLVQRMSKDKGFLSTPSAADLAKSKSPLEARKIYDLTAKQVQEAGFNINFGPVVDINRQENNPIITANGRSYGKDYGSVVRYGSQFVKAHQAHNVLTSLKHFPGHGSASVDSHKDFVNLSHSWAATEIKPFKLMIDQKLADMVMIGHLYHPAFSDGNKEPASLSKQAITHILRNKMNYQGLIITDDLEMAAIKKYYKEPSMLIKAINAGNDILLLSDARRTQPNHMEKIISDLEVAVKNKKISRTTIVKAYNRIMKAKRELQKFNAKGSHALSQ